MVSVLVTVFVFVFVDFSTAVPLSVVDVVLVFVDDILELSEPFVVAFTSEVVVPSDVVTGGLLVDMLSVVVVVVAGAGALSVLELIVDVEDESMLDDSALPLPHEAIKKAAAMASVLIFNVFISVRFFLVDDFYG